jgi:hypothetical protein
MKKPPPSYAAVFKKSSQKKHCFSSIGWQKIGYRVYVESAVAALACVRMRFTLCYRRAPETLEPVFHRPKSNSSTYKEVAHDKGSARDC